MVWKGWGKCYIKKVLTKNIKGVKVYKQGGYKMSNKEKLYKFYEMAGGDTEAEMQKGLDKVMENNRFIKTEEQAINFLLEEINTRGL